MTMGAVAGAGISASYMFPRLSRTFVFSSPFARTVRPTIGDDAIVGLVRVEMFVEITNSLIFLYTVKDQSYSMHMVVSLTSWSYVDVEHVAWKLLDSDFTRQTLQSLMSLNHPSHGERTPRHCDGWRDRLVKS